MDRYTGNGAAFCWSDLNSGYSGWCQEKKVSIGVNRRRHAVLSTLKIQLSRIGQSSFLPYDYMDVTGHWLPTTGTPARWDFEYMPFLTRKSCIIEVERCMLYQHIFMVSLQSAE